MQQRGWFRGLDLERPPAASVSEAVRSKQQLRIFQPAAAAALSKQLQILAAATNQLAKKIQLSTRKISSICSWARTSSIMAYSGPVIDVRVSRTIFCFHSIHHFWIQLKVTDLKRVKSRTLPKTTSPPKWIFFYWRIQDCFLKQKQLFNHFSALFQINFFHHSSLVTTVFWRTIIIPR